MDRYIGLDAHALIRVLRGIPGTRHLCLEEGIHATWLYEVLSPHVEEIVVAPVREAWLKKLPATARSLAELLMQEHDGLLELRKKAERRFLVGLAEKAGRRKRNLAVMLCI